MPTKVLRALAQEAAGLPEWLFEESYQAVGDLAETIALLLPAADRSATTGPRRHGSSSGCCRCADAARGHRRRLRACGASSTAGERLVYIKLITGSFRVGVSKLLVTRALAARRRVDAKRIAQRLVGYTDLGAQPDAGDYSGAGRAGEPTASATSDAAASRIRSSSRIRCSHPLARIRRAARAAADWQVEWKWDGIRAQVVKREGQVWLWSRGEELVTDRFPGAGGAGRALPDGTVLDGEIVVWQDGQRRSRSPSCSSGSAARRWAEAAARDPGGAARLRPARMARATICAAQPQRAAPRAARRAGRARRASPRCVCQPAAARRRLGRPRAPARGRARARRRRHDAEGATRATASAAPRTSASGGSGRSTRSPSTPC